MTHTDFQPIGTTHTLKIILLIVIVLLTISNIFTYISKRPSKKLLTNYLHLLTFTYNYLLLLNMIA